MLATAQRRVAAFSLPAALFKLDPLKSLCHSRKSQDQQITKRVQKMAAIQAVVTAAHGPFQE